MRLADFINLLAIHRGLLLDIAENGEIGDLVEQLERSDEMVGEWIKVFQNGLFCENCKHYRQCPEVGHICGITYSFVFPKTTLCGKFEPIEQDETR